MHTDATYFDQIRSHNPVCLVPSSSWPNRINRNSKVRSDPISENGRHFSLYFLCCFSSPGFLDNLPVLHRLQSPIPFSFLSLTAETYSPSLFREKTSRERSRHPLNTGMNEVEPPGLPSSSPMCRCPSRALTWIASARQT